MQRFTAFECTSRLIGSLVEEATTESLVAGSLTDGHEINSSGQGVILSNQSLKKSSLL